MLEDTIYSFADGKYPEGRQVEKEGRGKNG